MRIVELFSGSGTFSRVARERGHETLTVDLDHAADLRIDVAALDVDKLPQRFRRPDLVWLSPPCTTFSVARQYHYWPDGTPTEAALQGIETLAHGVRLLMQLGPALWFLENPRGRIRNLPLLDIVAPRFITYCQYGMPAQKPTYIWTNCDAWHPRQPCRPGDGCHGRFDTVVKRDSYSRATLPLQLCHDIIEAAELQLSGKRYDLAPNELGPLFAGVV